MPEPLKFVRQFVFCMPTGRAAKDAQMGDDLHILHAEIPDSMLVVALNALSRGCHSRDAFIREGQEFCLSAGEVEV